MPMLYYRSVEPEGEWRAAWQKPERTWSTLLINPRVNYLLACQGLLNQVENDVNELGEAEHQEFSSSVSYRLLDKLVRYSMREQGEEAVLRYQFKLMVASGGVANPETSAQVASEARFEDVLISPVMERDSEGVSE